MRRAHIRVWGVVQRVGFRYAARERAQALGLVGFAKNEKGGSVFMEVEGEEEGIREFLSFASTGPKHARVDRLELRFYRPEDKSQNFAIL